MTALPIRQDLRLLPHAGGCFPNIIRLTEVHGDFIPEVLSHLHNFIPEGTNLLFKVRYFPLDLIGYDVYSLLLLAPLLVSTHMLIRPSFPGLCPQKPI
jgi:hypothetical protein